MSIEDDLLKLSELKEKGAITAEEFEARKAQLLKPPAKRLNMTGLWWKLPVAVIGVSGMIYGSNTIKSAKSVTTDELPLCQSENATSTLREAFNQSQVARAENLSVIEIQNVTEIQPSTKERRSCAATITLNNASKIDVAFVLEKRTSGRFMLTFELRNTVQAYRYEPDVVVLQGMLLSALGETPDGVKITFPAVRLMAPITVQGTLGDDFKETEEGVVLVQMALNEKMMNIYKSLKGKRVEVAGTLFHQDNGHHYTKVLITPETITPID